MWLALFLIIPALAAFVAPSAVRVSEPRPLISVTFDEPVDPLSLNASLLDSNNTHIPLAQPVPLNSTSFEYRPASNLDEGIYTFKINANDLLGNPGPQASMEFEVLFTQLNITMVLPTYNTANISVFDIEISTDRDAECRYSEFDASWENLLGFDTVGSILHKKNSYDAGSSSRIDFFVKCNDSYSRSIISRRFDLFVDSSPPFITEIIALPDPVVDQSNVFTIISVATDDETVCRFNIGSAAGFESMPSAFAGFDAHVFRRIHYNQTEFPIVSDDYEIFIKCMNRAGLVSVADDSVTVAVTLTKAFR